MFLKLNTVIFIVYYSYIDISSMVIYIHVFPQKTEFLEEKEHVSLFGKSPGAWYIAT